jgi:hypothetical protein
VRMRRYANNLVSSGERVVKNLPRLYGSGRCLDALPDRLAPHVNVIAGESQNSSTVARFLRRSRLSLCIAVPVSCV